MKFSAALFALSAAALWGSSTVLGRFLSPRSSFFTITALRFLVALPLLFLIAWANRSPLPVPDGNQLARLTTMALIPGLAALLLYYRGLHGTPASIAAVAELCFPFMALLLNWKFLGQRPSLVQMAGFAIIWAVVWRIQQRAA